MCPRMKRKKEKKNRALKKRKKRKKKKKKIDPTSLTLKCADLGKEVIVHETDAEPILS